MDFMPIIKKLPVWYQQKAMQLMFVAKQFHKSASLQVDTAYF